MGMPLEVLSGRRAWRYVEGGDPAQQTDDVLKLVPDQRLLSVVSNLCRERLQVICELTDGRRRRGTEGERVGGRNDPVKVRRQVNLRAAGALDLRKQSIKRKTKVANRHSLALGHRAAGSQGCLAPAFHGDGAVDGLGDPDDDRDGAGSAGWAWSPPTATNVSVRAS
jgi:hypothetical protein